MKILIKDILPNESFYSYLSRLYVHSGIANHIEFRKMVFKRSNEYLDYNFANVLSDEIMKEINEKIGFENIMLDHTLFKYYVRFLPKDKKLIAWSKALENCNCLDDYLNLPKYRGNNNLRYCSECVKEDRLKFGESYFHIEHNIQNINYCSKHCCKLKNTNIEITKSKERNLIPLELVVEDLSTEYIDKDDINIKVVKYNVDCLNEDIDFDNDKDLSEYLSLNLEDKYISLRGERRYCSLILKDLKEQFNKLEVNKITKDRIGWIFRGSYYATYDVLLLSLFENIDIKDLCRFEGRRRISTKEFDDKVRKLYNEGRSYNSLGKEFGVNKEVIRKIILGTYDK